MRWDFTNAALSVFLSKWKLGKLPKFIREPRLAFSTYLIANKEYVLAFIDALFERSIGLLPLAPIVSGQVGDDQAIVYRKKRFIYTLVTKVDKNSRNLATDMIGWLVGIGRQHLWHA